VLYARSSSQTQLRAGEQGAGSRVPPDDQRQFVDRPQLKHIYETGTQADGHGFDFVDPAELAASNDAATYYAWDAKPGLRFVSIDTVSEGGVVGQSDDGNVDDPQWRWLEAQLAAADRAGKLVVVFGHHPIRTLTADVADEAASPCTTEDSHGHDVNPGCDLDPRPSSPLHLGDDLVQLLSAHDNVVAYVAGHTHENEIRPCGRTPRREVARRAATGGRSTPPPRPTGPSSTGSSS
jgi:3',5'-cyclic AMP phosphodiesterase CpdA